MKYTRPLLHHFDQIVALQNKNLFSALVQKERSGGFLYTAFTKEQFQSMDNSLGIIVALEGDAVCGYLCATTNDFNQEFPFPAAMIRHCAHLSYKDQDLKSYPYFIANPLCIDQFYRGTEVFLNLCKAVLAIIPRQYEIAISLISTENNRSISACKKAGAKFIHPFEQDEKKFWIILFDLDELRKMFG